MIKQQAHYRVTVFTNKETITITDPLTCHFNVQRGVLCDSTKANIQLYNLAPSTREMIFQDAFTFDESQWKYVHIEAGYNNTLSMIFKGRILQAYSHKGGGQTDIVTEIQVQALDIFDCQCSYTFKAGTTFMDAYQTLASTLPNCKIENVGALEGTFQTDTTFDGNTYEQLQKLTNGSAFVDNGVLNCLNPNEVIDVPVPIITDESGLLETPMRRDANLEIKILFEPRLIVGQLLEIKSRISPNFNGQFKVLGFTHDCTISGAQAGTRTTTVNLWIGPFLPQKPVQNGVATGGATPSSGFYKVDGTNITSVDGGKNPTWIMPCKGTITSKFGRRPSPTPGASSDHKGIDIAVPVGTKVVAVADGEVIAAGKADRYGYWVQIDHGKYNGKTITSEYGHISGWAVQVGQQVKKGQEIAKSGNSGISKGPHLHLTIKVNEKPVNPLYYVK